MAYFHLDRSNFWRELCVRRVLFNSRGIWGQCKNWKIFALTPISQFPPITSGRLFKTLHNSRRPLTRNARSQGATSGKWQTRLPS